MKKIKNIFKKKFKIEKVLIGEGLYYMQYAEYRFFPTWKKLMYHFNALKGQERWFPKVLDEHDSIIFMRRFKSVKDVEYYYKMEK